MTQHFLKSAKVRDFTAYDASCLSENDVFWFLVEDRWGSKENFPCPKCGAINTHYFRAKQRRWRCRDCSEYFSLTTGTPFQDRKMPFRKILIGLMDFTQAANGISHHELARKLDTQIKTAQAFVGKIREVLFGARPKLAMTGTIHMDGGYFGGRPRSGRVRRKSKEAITEHVEAMLTGKKKGKPPRSKIGKANLERRKKRRVVMVLRELYPEKGKGARQTIVAVCMSENEVQATQLATRYISKGATVMTDENPAYNRLSSWYVHQTVEHATEFATLDGVSDNQAESYFSRLRRYVLGVAHRIEPKYLADIAVEMAWREDVRRFTEKEKLRDLLTKIFSHGLSRWWRGYWQGYHRDGEQLWDNKS